MIELSIWVVSCNWSSRSKGEVKSIKLLQIVIQTEDMVTDTFAPLLIRICVCLHGGCSPIKIFHTWGEFAHNYVCLPYLSYHVMLINNFKDLII